MHRQTVTIQKIVNGGYGLGHLPSGQIILIQGGLPGENVIVTIQESKKNYLFGKVQQIKKNHPARITPPCIYYGSCGGCNLQHCDYNSQRVYKRDILIDLLVRQGGVMPGDIDEKVMDVIGAPSPLHYRQRIRLQVKGDGKLGFNRFRSHDIIEIDRCLLAMPSINQALAALKEYEDIHSLLELSNELELQHNSVTDKVSCLFNFQRKPRPADINAASRLCSTVEAIDRVFFTGEKFPIVGPVTAANKNADNLLTVRYPEIKGLQSPLTLSWEAGGFCQVNLEQNKIMIETVLEFCHAQPADAVLDLYCGMGNFAVPLSRFAGKVIGIEGQGSSIRCAEANASQVASDNTTFIKQPVHKGCADFTQKGETFDCIIIDPPRQGAPELAAQLYQLCKKRLIYISCDPATLCRDLKALCKEGFTIKKIQPIDMFPQTHHLETVVLLEKHLC